MIRGVIFARMNSSLPASPNQNEGDVCSDQEEQKVSPFFTPVYNSLRVLHEFKLMVFWQTFIVHMATDNGGCIREPGQFFETNAIQKGHNHFFVFMSSL
jgi:hypothetical protein